MYVLYLSNTQTVQVQAIGVHEEAANSVETWVSCNVICPVDVTISVSGELSGNPVMALEGCDGVQ